jgi:hypothetical protein
MPPSPPRAPLFRLLGLFLLFCLFLETGAGVQDGADPEQQYHEEYLDALHDFDDDDSNNNNNGTVPGTTRPAVATPVGLEAPAVGLEAPAVPDRSVVIDPPGVTQQGEAVKK